MREDTRELRHWASPLALQGDAVQHQMRDFGRWDWVEVAEEGRRLWNRINDQEAEQDSPVAAVLDAVAAQAAHGAFAAVAAALGVPAAALEVAVARWYENQDQPPVAVAVDQLISSCGSGAFQPRPHLMSNFLLGRIGKPVGWEGGLDTGAPVPAGIR